MAKWRWRAGGRLAALMACVTPGFGCMSGSSMNAADASTGSDGAGSAGGTTADGGVDRCQTTILGCQTVTQSQVVVPLTCNETVRTSILGHEVCVTALGCDSNQCVSGVASCFPECVQDAETDASEGGVVPPDGFLGARCTSDADCGSSGLICLKPTDDLFPGVEAGTRGQGGPPNGLCTTPCSASNHDLCHALHGACVTLTAPTPDHPDPTGYCWETCPLGPVAATKCHNRPEVACFQNVCMFVCFADSDCGTRKCADSVCVDQVPEGGSFGSACTDDTQCASRFCAFWDRQTRLGGGWCSQDCRTVSAANVGSECGFRTTTIASGPGPVGVCSRLGNTSGIGDLGYCLQLCDVPSDCSIGTETCVMDPLNAGPLSGHGYCLFIPDGGATPPSDSGGAADAGASTLPREAGP